ncbi:MAG: hypothetical protein JW768_07330 [Chitinispirillaceae bacterium]|nr:hypothetical protein [Chitinispirillaceae bacterium]
MRRILLIVMVCGMMGKVAATDQKFYGTIGTSSWWMKTERFYADTGNPLLGDTDRTQRFTDSIPMNNINMLPYGTFGYKVTKGSFTGCIELGIVHGLYDFVISGNATYQYLGQKKTLMVYAKKWNATWQPNDVLALLIGQDFTPANFFPSNQVFWKENSFNNIGCLYTGRSPMLQLSIESPNKFVEGKIAVIQPDTSCIWINGYESAINSEQNYYSCETEMPKLEGSFGLTLDNEMFNLRCKAAGGYQTYKTVLFTERVMTAENSKTPIESWVAGIDLGFGLFDRVSISCDAFYGKNIATYGVYVGSAISWWQISDFLKPFGPEVHFSLPENPDAMTVYNGYATEIALILNAKISDILSLEAGGGGINGSHDYEEYMNKWNPAYGWYFQTSFTLGESMKFAPEVGQYIWGPHMGFGRIFYAGINSKFAF